jgi:prepilin-type N-terminal cleavage/methylation domain-containing protein
MTVTSNITIEARAGERGFTLIELLVVLSIMGLLAAAAVSSFARPSRWTDRQASALVLNAISEARAKAIRTGKVVELDGSVLPPNAHFSTSDGRAPSWYPDGTALPARLTRDGQLLLAVNAMTGLAEETP